MLFLVGLVRWLASGVYVVMQFILAFMTASESDSCWSMALCLWNACPRRHLTPFLFCTLILTVCEDLVDLVDLVTWQTIRIVFLLNPWIDSKICQSITTLIPVYDGYLTFIPRMDLGMRLNDCHGNHILVILDRWLLYEGCHEFLGSRNSSDTIGEYSTNWKKCTGVQFRKI